MLHFRHEGVDDVCKGLCLVNRTRLAGLAVSANGPVQKASLLLLILLTIPALLVACLIIAFKK